MKLAKNSLDNDGVDFYTWHFDIFWDIAEAVGMDGIVLCECGHKKKLYFKQFTSLKCGRCQKAYSPMAGTAFANSKILLPMWLLAIYIIDKNPKITLVEFTKKLDCTNVTACNLRRKIRLLPKDGLEYTLMKKYKHEIIGTFY